MLLDVTQPIYSGMPKISHLPDVTVTPVGLRSEGHALETALISIPSHAGTHVDAPSHALDNTPAIDQLAVDRFMGPGVVSSVRRQPGELITVDDVLAGGPPVQRGDMLLLDTGWAAHFGTDAYYDHPSLDPELAQWMVDQGITMMGIDTLTPDLPFDRRPPGFDFPVHHILLGNDVLIAENLATLTAAAGHRVQVYAFPLLVRGGDAGHVRVVLDVLKDNQTSQ
jgi:kynurenine formamidase